MQLTWADNSWWCFCGNQDSARAEGVAFISSIHTHKQKKHPWKKTKQNNNGHSSEWHQSALRGNCAKKQFCLSLGAFSVCVCVCVSFRHRLHMQLRVGNWSIHLCSPAFSLLFASNQCLNMVCPLEMTWHHLLSWQSYFTLRTLANLFHLSNS